jgi:FixJ family two-component response regulator
MPGVNGVEAAIEICTMVSECRVLLFSGEPGSRLLVQTCRFNGREFAFIEKPIPPMDLLSQIRRLRAA